MTVVMEEALTPQRPLLPPSGSASMRAQDWWEPYGLQLPADSKQTSLGADWFLSIIQGSVEMRDAAQDGSSVNLGASHHPTCSFSVTNR